MEIAGAVVTQVRSFLLSRNTSVRYGLQYKVTRDKPKQQLVGELGKALAKACYNFLGTTIQLGCHNNDLNLTHVNLTQGRWRCRQVPGNPPNELTRLSALIWVA